MNLRSPTYIRKQERPASGLWDSAVAKALALPAPEVLINTLEV